MTTGMKQLLALLLLGCAFAHHGDEEGHEQLDPCTEGVAAMRLFLQYRGCPQPNPFHRMGLLANSMSNMTVDNMNNLFTVFCSTWFPRIKQCFQRNIQSCSQAQRSSLMRVVEETGFVCEPNTTRINDVMDHLLSKLTDLDLAKNKTCNKLNESMVYSHCHHQSLEATGITGIRGMDMEEAAPKLKMVYRKVVECTVNEVHDRLNSCPQWRGQAIRAIGFLFFPPLLGKSMPFSTEEIDQLFRWQSGSQTPMDMQQQSLLDLLK